MATETTTILSHVTSIATLLLRRLHVVIAVGELEGDLVQALTWALSPALIPTGQQACLLVAVVRLQSNKVVNKHKKAITHFIPIIMKFDEKVHHRL